MTRFQTERFKNEISRWRSEIAPQWGCQLEESAYMREMHAKICTALERDELEGALPGLIEKSR